jgi:hypothetical protein
MSTAAGIPRPPFHSGKAAPQLASSDSETATHAFVVLQHVSGRQWRLLGEVPRRPGLTARAARSTAILEATDGAAMEGERYAAVLRSEWRVAQDWTPPPERKPQP